MTTNLGDSSMLYALWQTMRPRQWTKNAFVFVALIFDGQLSTLRILQVSIAFGLLCLMSSSVYLMNDLADIESDREHPTKRFRPLPAGQLNPQIALITSILLAVGSSLAGFFLTRSFGFILLAYLASQILYTFWFKHIALLDVASVTSGFILRIAAGVTVIDVQRFSPWLYVFGGFLALFMVLGKRRQEIVLLGQDAGKHRAILDEYNLEFLDKLIGIVTTSAIVSYSLYTFLAEGLPDNHIMMLTIPFVIYGIFRYLYLIHIKGEGGAPEEILLQDRPMQIDLMLCLCLVIIAIYIY